MLKLHRFGLVLSLAVVSMLVYAVNAFAAADPLLEDTSDSVTSYFGDNLPVIIAAFIAVAMALWVIGLLFAKVGVRKPKSGS